MDNYYVGSVADLISEGKTKSKKNKTLFVQKEVHEEVSDKPKTKKKNIKENTNTDVSISKNFNENTCVQDSKEVNKKTKSGKTFLAPSSSKSDQNRNEKFLRQPIEETETMQIKNVKSKKRKKALTEEENDLIELPKNKEPKEDLLNLDNVPSDSDDCSENSYNQKTNDVKKKFTYTDFTENTVFVGNIPISFDKQKVCKLFSKFGKIKSARIRCVPIADINMSKKVAAVKKKFNPNRNSLVAYVKFESKDSVNSALEANGLVVDGHHLRVDLAVQNKKKDINKSVFVGGLPFDTEDDELWEFFENCGQIDSVRVIRDSHTTMGKGFGYVNFNSSASVELALQLDGQQFKKRTINVKRCVKAKNKNKQNAFGKSKSMKITNQLLSKKGKKFKILKKKDKETNKIKLPENHQGKKADIKEKKKKKLSKADQRKRKIIKILGGQ